MNIIKKTLAEIKPYEKNPRKNDDAVKYVAESIKQFGFKVPIIIDKDNIIVCGHTRYKAAKKLKLETVPCIMADDLTDEQIKAFRLADNKTGEYAEWDWELLNQELYDLSNFDMEMFGFDSPDVPAEEIKDDEYDVENAIEEIKEPTVKYGEIYKLGNHILMCGDSTEADDVKKLMQGKKADLVITDPPYNVDISNSQEMKIKNDNMKESEFQLFLSQAFANLEEHLKKGGSFYIWLCENTRYEFETALRENNLKPRQCLIWVKNSFTFGRRDYKWQHEPCLYGWKDGATHYFAPIFNLSSILKDKNMDIEKLKKEELKKIIIEMLEKTPTTVINANKPLANDLHPTMKPISLIAREMENSSTPDDIVLDLFGGSGTTLIVAEQMNRKCRMMEYDPVYATVIINRWEEFTGKKAELLSSFSSSSKTEEKKEKKKEKTEN